MIDTRNKRASVVGLAFACRLLAPNPDGSLATVADRQQVAGCYAGIDAGAITYEWTVSAVIASLSPSITVASLSPAIAVASVSPAIPVVSLAPSIPVASLSPSVPAAALSPTPSLSIP